MQVSAATPRVGLALCLILLVVAPPADTQKPATAAQQTGEKIGTIVKTAIDTAFPAVSSLMKLIWPGGKNSDKKTKKEVQDDIEKVQADLKKQVMTKLQPAAQISEELGVIQEFGRTSVKAGQNIRTMRTLVTVLPPGSELWSRLNTEWRIASTYLAPLKDTEKIGKQIDKVREPVINARLRDLQDARADIMQRIDDGLKNQNDIQDVKEQLNAMSAFLYGIDSIGAAELGNLQQEIKGLVNWASGAAGADEPVSTDAELLRIADEAVSAVKKAKPH